MRRDREGGRVQYGERVAMRTSRKFSDAAVSLTRTWFGPGVGMGEVCFVRWVTAEAVEGIVHAVFVVGEDMMEFVKVGVGIWLWGDEGENC